MGADEALALMQARIERADAQHDADQQRIAELRYFAEVLVDAGWYVDYRQDVDACCFCGAESAEGPDGLRDKHVPDCPVAQARAWLASHPASTG